MSASRSKTRSREAAVPPLELVGRGTTSCVVRAGPNRLVKIVTKLSDVEPEDVRAALLALDPQQRHLAGPLSVVVRAPTEAEREALRRCVRERPMKKEKMDHEAPLASFVELMDAGESIGALKERIAQLEKRGMLVEARRARLTVAQAASILVDTIAALEMLHTAKTHEVKNEPRGWSHGDLHIFNIAVQFAEDEPPKARLIDFGQTGRAFDPATGIYTDLSGDMKGFVGVASTVLGLVNSDAEPERYRCLSNLLTSLRRGMKGHLVTEGLRECAAGPAVAPAPPAGAPAGPSRSPGSPSARLGARRRMMFHDDIAESPAAPASAARRRARSGEEEDDGAGPSKRALVFGSK
jgi:hypothetical protein